MPLPIEPAKPDLRLRSSLSLDSNKPDSNDFHLQCSLLYPHRPSPSSSSSSSGSTTGGINGSCTYAGDHMVTTKLITCSRSSRHRRSGSEPLIYFSNSAVNLTSPASNTLPAGNIYPSGKVGRSGIMSHCTAAGSDVLGNGVRNYGHGSVMRRGIVGEAAAWNGLDQGMRRVMVSMDPEEVRFAGNEFYRRGRFEEALRVYDKAVEICPENATCRSNRAAALIRLGRLEEGLKSYEDAFKLDPSNVRAHQGLALLHIRFGQVERARRHMFWPGLLPDQIELKKLEEVELHMRKCADARKIGDWKTVLSESNAAVQAGSDSSSLLMTAKAEASLLLDRLEEADSTIQLALQLDISSPPSSLLNLFGLLYNSYTYMVNAQVEIALGRFENAVASAEKASLIDPGNVEMRMTLKKVRSVARARTQGNDLFNAGKFEEACLAYGEGLKFAPSNPVLCCNRSACMSKLGLWEKSIEDCNEALRVVPNHTKALLRRAASNGKLGRWAESVRDYEVLRMKLPGDSEVAGALLNAQVALKASRGNDASSAIVGGQVEVITGLEQYKTAISLHANSTAFISSQVPILTGENFSDWKEIVLLKLAYMDIDLAFRMEEPPLPTDTTSVHEKNLYEKWERSNRLSLALIKTHISKAIRGSIPECPKAKDFMKAVEDQFVKSDKALASTLMKKLSSIKYDSAKGVRVHIMQMRDIASQLNSLKIEFSESFLVNFILNSLPIEFGPFKISYNTHKEDWSVNELLTMCVQEEERLKNEKIESAHLAAHFKNQAKKTKSVFKGKKEDKAHANLSDYKVACFFCKKKGHMKKDCFKYKKWLEKKGLPKPEETNGE